MSLLPFSPPPGLNSDDTTFSAEGRWADGSNVRFWLGKPQVIGGWDIPQTSSADVGEFTGVAFDMLSWNAVGGAYVAVAGTAGVYITLYTYEWSSATWTTLKSATLNTDRQNWSMALFGTTLVMCGNFTSGLTGSNTIWASTLSTTYQTPTQITQAPSSTDFILVTPQRQLLAFGCVPEAGGDDNGLCIRGSDIEDYTDWTTSATNNAFEHILDGKGTLMGAAMVGPYLAVWTDQELHMGEFIGDPAQTYRFTKVGDNCGLRNRRCVQVVDGVAYWNGFDGLFRRWTPGGPIEVIPCPILRDFLDNTSDATDGGGQYRRRPWMMVNPGYREVWFFYPDGRDGSTTATRYLAYSIDQNVWFRGQLARTAGTPAGRGKLLMVSNVDADDATGQIFEHETGDTANGSAMSWHIQSADVYLDESQTRTMIRRMIPDFEDQAGDVSLTLYMRDYPHSSPVTKGPYTIAEGAEKVDFRASGKIAAIRFSGGDADGSYVRLGKQLFDVTPLGMR